MFLYLSRNTASNYTCYKNLSADKLVGTLCHWLP